MRELAEQSKHAASSIAELIVEMQAETGRTVGVVEEVARRTEESTAVVAAARTAFTEIGQAVSDVNERMAEIVQATQDVAALAEQSSAATERVSASTEQTSASAQQLAATAQQVAGTAASLGRLVDQFRIEA